MTKQCLTVDDFARAGFCADGIRTVYAAYKDRLPEELTLREILTTGLPLDVAIQLNDGLINKAIELKAVAHGE